MTAVGAGLQGPEPPYGWRARLKNRSMPPRVYLLLSPNSCLHLACARVRVHVKARAIVDGPLSLVGRPGLLLISPAASEPYAPVSLPPRDWSVSSPTVGPCIFTAAHRLAVWTIRRPLQTKSSKTSDPQGASSLACNSVRIRFLRMSACLAAHACTYACSAGG